MLKCLNPIVKTLVVLTVITCSSSCVTVESLRKARASIPPPPPEEEGPEKRLAYEESMLSKQEGILKQLAPEKENVNPIIEGEQLVTAAIYARQGRQKQRDPQAYQLFHGQLLSTIEEPKPRQEIEGIDVAENQRRLAAWAVYALGELQDPADLPYLVAALEVDAQRDPSGEHRLHALHGLSYQMDGIAADMAFGKRVLVGADAMRRACESGAVGAEHGSRARVLATYLIDELKNLRSIVALEEGYLAGKVPEKAALSVLTWNHQLLSAIAAGERAAPKASLLSGNRRTLLGIAAMDAPASRRAARLLLAASWPRSTARFLAERIVAGSEQADDALQLINLLPLVDQLATYRPRGGGVSVDEPAAIYDAEDVLPEDEWETLRTQALEQIAGLRHGFPLPESEALLAHLARHDPQVLAGWLRVANDPALGEARLLQEMRHRHQLLASRVVARDRQLLAALEDAIAADIQAAHARVRQLALQYLEERAPQKVVAAALASLPGIVDEGPDAAAAMVDVLIQALRVQEQEGPGDLRDCEALIGGDAAQVLGAPMARGERDVRQRWAAFLIERRPELLLRAVVKQVEAREDAFDLQLLGDLVQRNEAMPEPGFRGLALDALLHASRSADVERQLLALRLLGEWNDAHAIAALAARLESGELPAAAAELCRLAILGRLRPQEAQP